MSITFNFWSLNRVLLSFAHTEILLSSMLAMFSISLTVLALVKSRISSAKAIIFVRFENFRLRREL